MKGKKTLYQKIARSIEEQIEHEVLLLGDKLPSVRSAQKLHNVSLNTIKQAYLELESRSLIESRPKSGYFVSKSSRRKLSLPTIAIIQSTEKSESSQNLVDKVYNSISNPEITQFGLSVPGKNFLPLAKLNKGIINYTKMRNDVDRKSVV